MLFLQVGQTTVSNVFAMLLFSLLCKLFLFCQKNREAYGIDKNGLMPYTHVVSDSFIYIQSVAWFCEISIANFIRL